MRTTLAHAGHFNRTTDMTASRKGSYRNYCPPCPGKTQDRSRCQREVVNPFLIRSGTRKNRPARPGGLNAKPVALHAVFLLALGTHGFGILFVLVEGDLAIAVPVHAFEHLRDELG